MVVAGACRHLSQPQILANSVATNYLDLSRMYEDRLHRDRRHQGVRPRDRGPDRDRHARHRDDAHPRDHDLPQGNNPFHKAKSAVYKKFNNEQFDLNRARAVRPSAVQIASFVRATTGGKDTLTRHDMQALLVELCEGDAALATRDRELHFQEANLDGKAR